MPPLCFIIQKTLTSYLGSGRYDDLTEAKTKIMEVHSTLKSANQAAEAMTRRAQSVQGGVGREGRYCGEWEVDQMRDTDPRFIKVEVLCFKLLGPDLAKGEKDQGEESDGGTQQRGGDYRAAGQEEEVIVSTVSVLQQSELAGVVLRPMVA